MYDDLKEILITRQEISRRVCQLGEQLQCDYAGKNPLMVCILKGASIFYSDLVRCMNIPLEMDFMVTSSYGKATNSSGEVRILKDLDTGVENRHVILVEDIVDTGHTLSYLMNNIKSRGAKSIKICSLLDKPDRRRVNIAADYLGFTIPDEFVVGFGLDFAEKYRNLPDIGVLKPEVYQ